MAEKVGELYYSVTLDTREMIDGQRKVDRELKNTSNSLDGMTTKLTATAAAVAVLAAGFAAIKLARLADEFRLLASRVEIAAESVESGAQAFSELTTISQRTSTSLSSNIELFNRLNSSMKAMGGTQEDTLRLTELVAKAMRVSGASVQEAASTVRQFGQALGKGSLNGDELTSLLENAPYLARKLAEGLRVPIGALKDLGEEGKLTSNVIVDALNSAASDIERDFQKVPQTIEAAMQVARDAAALAVLKFDELTGSSAALAGVTKGLGDVFTELGKQIGAANDQAGNLGRNESIANWANLSRTALSYLIDAADTVWQTISVLGRNVAFVFDGIGKEIGGIGAQVAAVLRGDFAGARAISEAMVADSEARRKALDEADARTLSRAKTFGKQMREAWDQGAGGGRGSVNPTAAPSQLSAPAAAGGGTKKGAAGPKFDALAYLSDLRKAQASEISIINETEAEKLRIAKRNLDEKKLSEAQYVEAVKLIQTAAEDDRVELMRKTQEKINQERERADLAAQRAAEQRKSNQDVAKREIAATNPIDAIRFEEEQKIAVIEQYRLQDLANTQLYEDAKAAIHAKAAADIKAVQDASMVAQLQGYGQLFGGIADITKTFAGEQDDTYKALFAASKAFAMADAIVKIQQGIASAASLPFPANLGAMATVAAQTAGIVSTISGTSYGGGRQYGGPVSSGSMYRVNETGAPEMFTANNGNQYMLPTKSGSVTAADSIGGGGISVVVNVDASGSSVEGDGAQSKQFGAMIGNAVRSVLMQEKRNGGLLA